MALPAQQCGLGLELLCAGTWGKKVDLSGQSPEGKPAVFVCGTWVVLAAGAEGTHLGRGQKLLLGFM